MENKINNKEYFLAKWLEGKLTDHELKQLVSSNDYQLYLNLRRGISNFELLEQPLNSSLKKIKNRIFNKRKATTIKINYKWALSIAASLAIIFGLYFLMPSSEISHSTAFGQQKVIELPDGSLVTINSKSTIEFNPDSWQSSRILNLSGEAYFKVKKGSQFTVNTPNGDVVVLGTEFNVNSSHNFFEVICYEGKVKVEKNSKAYILTPGKIIRKFNENKLEENFTNKNFPDWTTGESTFVSVPLEFVIKSIEKQYNLTVISNQVDITRVYTGSFTHNNLDVALATVFKTMNIKYLKKDKGIISLE
jgi:ferric-dicitrate binding protein FerR (iron transport regulator)